MSRSDSLLDTIEAVHAAGLDETRWTDALATVAHLFGACAASLEDFAKRPIRLLYLKTAGVPPQGETTYLEYYARTNSRARFAFQNPSKRILCDYEFTDERTMDRDPYYAKYLAPLDLRYFLSGQLLNTRDNQAIISVQRTRSQGHVDGADIALMKRLTPHLRQALDTATRLRCASNLGRSLEAALDWLADGVALLEKDGTVLYANEALQAAARLGDGVSISKRVPSFAAKARSRFSAALAATANIKQDGIAAHDFAAFRPSGAPAYLVSLRPLVATSRSANAQATAIMFVRDPTDRRLAPEQMLRTVFGLTQAEASLALALQAGQSPADHASERSISLNTVYTHLRRIKDKTGCTRMVELIRKLGDLHGPIRRD